MSAVEPQAATPREVSWAELEALLAEADAKEALPVESFAAVVPEILDDVPEAERRADLRRALGMLAPSWAVEAGVVNGTGIFEGANGELLRSAVTMAFATDRGPVLYRLAKHLFAHGVNQLVVPALLHGWATHFCQPTPTEDEVFEVVEMAWKSSGRPA